jgi:hypothetical protein
MAEITSQKKRLYGVIGLCMVANIADGLCCGLGFILYSNLTIVLSQFIIFILQMGYLGGWGHSLYKLNKKVTNVDKLMPNQRLFILHGSSLVGWVGFYLIFLIALSLTVLLEGDALLIDLGIMDLAGALAVISECFGYWLVLILMMPFTAGQVQRKAAFQTFLLEGFINTSEMKKAIMEQNPNMSEREKSMLEDEMSRFQSFLDSTGMTQSIVGEMVHVDTTALAFNGSWRIRKVHSSGGSDEVVVPEYDQSVSPYDFT